MKTDCTKLNNEELKRLLHKENFKFSHGIEKGLSFEALKEIRQHIRAIIAELEVRANLQP